MLNRKSFLFLLGSVLLGGFVCASIPQEMPQKKIRVEVEMVSLPVVVTTRDGKRVPGLEKEDFRIYEDKIEQKIEAFSSVDEPFSVALLLDASGSTTLKLERIQNEAIRFIHRISPQDSIAVVTFAQEVRLLEDFTENRTRAAAAIRRVSSGGFTVLYEAMWLAFREVLPSAHQRSAVVLFTDGVDTASVTATKVETRELAKESRSPVYCIYFNTQAEMQRTPPQSPPSRTTFPPVIGIPTITKADPRGRSTEDYMGGRQYLTDLAELSGGMVFEALNMEDLGPAFDAIAQQLASQYSIGYYPSNQKHDGKYRKIEVKMNRSGLYVQARQGYFAPYTDPKKK
jgi:Ca-activated chloride channel homolog